MKERTNTLRIPISRLFLFAGIAGIVLFYLLGYSLPSAPEHGNVSITVKYKGTPPNPEPLKTQKAKSLCGIENITNETMIINKGNEIKNAMIYVKGATGMAQPKDYALVNKNCAFSPHVGFATAGSKLIISNEDAVLHNTHGYFVVGKMKKTLLNTALPKGTKPITNGRALTKTGLVEMTCDAHEWMSAKIIVVNNPYHAITDDKGMAEIKNLPAGEYELNIYHETLGELTKKVNVTAGQTTAVSIAFQ